MPTSSTHLRWHSSCLWHALRDGDCTVCQEPREQRCVFWSDLEDSWSLRPILQPAGNLQNVFEKTGAKGQKQCKATAQAKARLKRRNWRVNKTVFSTRPTTDKQERNMLYVKHMYCDWLWFVLVIVFFCQRAWLHKASSFLEGCNTEGIACRKQSCMALLWSFSRDPSAATSALEREKHECTCAST